MQVRKQQLELDMEHVFFLNYSTTQIYAPEKAMATHSSILAWSILWTEEPGGLKSAAAKSLQSCPTLCDPTDGSPRGSPIPGILQARTPEWVAISFSNA